MRSPLIMGKDRDTIQSLPAETLRGLFPVTARFVGPETIDEAAKALADEKQSRDCCPDHPFASYLERTAGNDRAFLCDLARLEWAVFEAERAADAPALGEACLNEFAPEALTYLTFTLHPATRVVTSAYPILDLWRSPIRRSTSDIRLPKGRPRGVLVTRPEDKVQVSPLPMGAALTLQCLAKGATLGIAYTDAFERHPDFDLCGLLRHCVTQGAFSNLSQEHCPKFGSCGVRKSDPEC